MHVQGNVCICAFMCNFLTKRDIEGKHIGNLIWKICWVLSFCKFKKNSLDEVMSFTQLIAVTSK